MISIVNQSRLDVEIYPFTWCNLACDFCELCDKRFEYKDKALARSFDKIKQYIDQYKPKALDVQFFGGEIFADRIPDDIIDQYYQFFDDLTKYLKANNIEYRYALKSNFVHHRIDKLIDLATKFNIVVSTSFDLDGRFTKEYQIDLWLANVDKVNKLHLLDNINIVMHDRNIKAILTGSGKYFNIFKQLYEQGLVFDFEMYNCIKENDDLQPNVDQLTKFIKYLIDYYPNTNIVKNYVKHFNKQHDSLEGRGVASIEIYGGDKVIIDTNDRKQSIKDKGCLSCKYFGDQCVIRYPSEYTDNTQCITKAVFDYLASK